MKNVLILGATGQIARWVVQGLPTANDLGLTLFARSIDKLQRLASKEARVVQDNDLKKLSEVIKGQHIAYANLTGDDIDAQALGIVEAMKAAGVSRLIFVTSLGIYDEVPGKFGAWNRREIGAYLPPFRRAADAIEGSALDCTILRPAWLTDDDEVSYEITRKGTPFKGTEVSRKSVADLVVKIIRSPTLHLPSKPRGRQARHGGRQARLSPTLQRR